MNLTLNGDIVARSANNSQVERALRSLDASNGADAFVILEKEPMHYLQVAGDADSGFHLEYQEESLEKHYTCVTPDLTEENIIRTFLRYLEGDSRWKSDHQWEVAPLGSYIPVSKSWLRYALIGAAVIVTLIVLNACTPMHQERCLESPKHVLVQNLKQGRYLCHRARNHCEKAFAITKTRESCEASEGCTFNPGKCFCPARMQCICGGGPTATCSVTGAKPSPSPSTATEY